MANRHLSRSVVLQTLFEWDFRSLVPEVARDSLLRNIAEFAPAAGDAAAATAGAMTVAAIAATVTNDARTCILHKSPVIGKLEVFVMLASIVAAG